MKEFVMNGIHYTVCPCSVVPFGKLRCRALLVTETHPNGDRFQVVTYGWDIEELNSNADFAEMVEWAAWNSDKEILSTVKLL